MPGTIQIDVDGLWTYRRYVRQKGCGDDPGPDPAYSEGVPRFLDLLAAHDLKATFFIVGRDARHPAHQAVITRIVEQGHEIANHSMNHPLRFNQLDSVEMEQEITAADEVLRQLNKGPLSGFRAPTFSVDAGIIPLLIRKGYLYDSSVLPSGIAPLLMNAGHSLLKRHAVRLNAGNIRFALAPPGPYRPDPDCIWKPGTSPLVEVPVSVMPFWRTPIHSTYAFVFGVNVIKYALRRLSRRAIPYVYLFHAIDLVDIAKHNLALPAFRTLPERAGIVEALISALSREADPVTTRELVSQMRERI
ncbi:MAG: polysaccharide deacetylase family protein [Candidatus Omnitrophica bacterium]|nr:polysaccharide deacetylase family protein [Candidatus Omnitrophota bacterium]